jgi:hypothetical protein
MNLEATTSKVVGSSHPFYTINFYIGVRVILLIKKPGSTIKKVMPGFIVPKKFA